MEAIIKVKVQVQPDGDAWKAAMARIGDEDKLYPLTNLSGLTAAQVYVMYGITTPSKEVSYDEAFSEAEKILSKGLASIGDRTMMGSAEATDLLLDTLNALMAARPAVEEVAETETTDE